MRRFFEKALPVFLIVGVITFLVWVFLVLLPILWIEVKYQGQKFWNSLGFSSARELFVPDFSNLSLVGMSSENRDYGIIVPKINLDENVIFNVDPNDESAYKKALKTGIAHASSTAFPGQKGLAYYFAHSSTPNFRFQYNAVFYLLNKLEPGDAVYILYEGKRYRYSVTEKAIKTPGEVDFLYQDYSDEMMVMQTCWPPGTTTNRLLVFARRDE